MPIYEALAAAQAARATCTGSCSNNEDCPCVRRMLEIQLQRTHGYNDGC